MAVAVAAVGVVVGAVFAVASNRPSRTLAYTALVGMSVLALRLFGADGRASGAFWFAAAAYSASVALAAIALASVEGGSARRLDEWAGAAREHAAGIALLAVAALGLCGLPASVGFWVHAPLGAPLAPAPAWVGLVARAAPLVASLGWGRVLWVSVHPSLAPRAQCGRLARAYLWALVAAGVGLFLWPSLLTRLGEMFATALGSL
jgi:NADH:ubiquinone oxidoreductase subunit 2 (subunit N)